jgi:hypothetical protein
MPIGLNGTIGNLIYDAEPVTPASVPDSPAATSGADCRMGLGLGGVIRLQPCVSLSGSTPAGDGIGDYMNNTGVIAIDCAHIYRGYDNVLEFYITEDGVTLDDLSAVTKIQLDWKSESINSVDDAELFDIDTDTGLITVLLGDALWPVGIEYATVIVFDGLNTDGVIFASDSTETKLKISVH